MQITLENIDSDSFDAIRDRATSLGRDVGEVLNEAMRVYLMRIKPVQGSRISLRSLRPELFSEGNESLSEEIDETLYGVRLP